MKDSDTTITIRKEIKSRIEKFYKDKYENWNSWFIRVIKLMDENKMRKK